MAIKYEFLPGRGSHYSGRVRSFVLRNRKVRKRKVAGKVPQAGREEEQPLVLADSKNLLHGRLDPFQTSAAQFGPKEDRMLYHYVEACIPNLGRRTSDSFFPPRDIDWALIRGDPVLMATAVQFAAMSLAFIESSGAEVLEYAERCRAVCLRAFQQKIARESGYPSDELLHIFIGIIATDTHIRLPSQRSITPSQSKDKLQLHIQGFRAALAARSGWDIRRYPTVLQFEMIWQDVVANGAISAGMTAFSSRIQRMLPVPEDSLPATKLVDVHWRRLCVLEFVGAYTDFYEMASRRLSARYRVKETRTSPEPRDLCLPGTPAYKCMASEETAVVRPIAAIILFNLQLYEHEHDSSDEVAYQYWALHRKFRRCAVGLGSGPAYLLYGLGMTSDLQTWLDVDTMALLSRMLSVEVRLSPETRCRLKSSLLSFISAMMAEEALSWWSPDEVYSTLHEELLHNDET